MTHLLKAGRVELKRRVASEDLVKNHPETVNIRPGINIARAKIHLLRTHICKRPKQMVHAGETSIFVHSFRRRLGNAEINHLGHRNTLNFGNQNIRGLQISMDDSLLMRMVDGTANLDEQLEALTERQPAAF